MTIYNGRHSLVGSKCKSILEQKLVCCRLFILMHCHCSFGPVPNLLGLDVCFSASLSNNLIHTQAHVFYCLHKQDIVPSYSLHDECDFVFCILQDLLRSALPDSMEAALGGDERCVLDTMRLVDLLLVLLFEGRKALPKSTAGSTGRIPGLRRLDSTGERKYAK